MSQFLSTERLVEAIGPWTYRQGPLYLRLADAIQEAADQAALEEGARLPAERTLAEALDVARGTVVAAYAALADRGVVQRKRGSGTTIAERQRKLPGSHHRSPELDRMAASGPGIPIDLTIGAPPPSELTAELAASAADALRGGAPHHGYAPMGLPALRDGLAHRLTTQGLPTTPDELLITSGAQGAISLLATALVRPGDRVLVESPTYPGAIEVFSRAGAVVLGIRRDAIGPRPEDLERLIAVQPPALVFLVPTCHNPTGSIMHEQRRREVLAVCRRHDVLMVEDLTLSDLVYEGEKPPHIASMTETEDVVAIGSFSKALWGGLRTGFLRADRSLVLRLGRLKTARDLGGGLLDQAAVVAALPIIDDVIERARTRAREHYEVVSKLLHEAIPEWKQTVPKGGYSIWCRLPAGHGDRFAATALSYGVGLTTGAAAAPQEMLLDHVRITCAADLPLLREAVDRLQAAWRAQLGAAAHAA